MVPAALYLEYFASDRTHMLEAGSQIDYQKPPPPHACIVSRSELPLMHLFYSWMQCRRSQHIHRKLSSPRLAPLSQHVVSDCV